MEKITAEELININLVADEACPAFNEALKGANHVTMHTKEVTDAGAAIAPLIAAIEEAGAAAISPSTLPKFAAKLCEARSK